MKISVIVPALNEAANIGECLRSVRTCVPDCELIVVDARSSDDTAKIAAELADTVLTSHPGRGKQCQLGASAATGELLMFLHADCTLSPGLIDAINLAFADPKTRIATLRIQFNAPGWRYRFIEFCSRFDSILTTFGDQGLLVRKTFFQQIAGMPDLPLFEDVEFFRGARRSAKIIKLQSTIRTSARRFQRMGFWRTHLLNTGLIVGYLFGVKAERLHRIYYAVG
jgi:rSAM/selenodomain-associated transferase 2